jgi:hypothetical protein
MLLLLVSLHWWIGIAGVLLVGRRLEFGWDGRSWLVGIFWRTTMMERDDAMGEEFGIST